jgi:predicted nucleic acid-binding protein
MSILLDTNILVCSVHAGHAMQRLAADFVDELLRQGETLCLVPQNVYEFWVVCTRPAAQNGLGMSLAQAQTELARLKTLFTLLDDTPAIFPHWEQLVIQYQVQGKNAHDARLVAAMIVHGLNRILTRNVGDFQRYQTLTVLDSQQVIAPSP